MKMAADFSRRSLLLDIDFVLTYCCCFTVIARCTNSTASALDRLCLMAIIGPKGVGINRAVADYVHNFLKT
jgi:hypothetical protein